MCESKEHPIFNSSVSQNKHCWQLRYTPKSCDLGIQELNLVLDMETAGWRKYYERRRNEKSVMHRGQAKLLWSEIEFLTEYSQDGDTVVYAGAAPGTHIKILSDMFPELKFVLVDPAKFTVEKTERISIREKTMFTDEIAQEFAGRNDVLFISDIRSTDPFVDPKEENEKCIKRDMADQARWHRIMRPRFSIFKFRLPWPDHKNKEYVPITTYFGGSIYLPIWGPESTTESRLVVARDSEMTKEYNNEQYEGNMFYFNSCTRVARYHHGYYGESGLDHCFDCAAAVDVLENYCKKRPAIPRFQKTVFDKSGEHIIPMTIPEMIDRIMETLHQRTFDKPNPDKQKLRANINKHQLVDGKLPYRVTAGRLSAGTSPDRVTESHIPEQTHQKKY